MDIVKQLTDAKLRVTFSRINVLSALYELNRNVTADEIYIKCREKNAKINISTIYKILIELENKQIVRCILLGKNKNLFGLKKGVVSLNIVSYKTGKLIDSENLKIQEKFEDFIKSLGFNMESAEIVIYKK